MNIMEYYPAVDMDQRIGRTGNFITMVLGYIVVNLIYQSSALIGFNAYDLWMTDLDSSAKRRSD
jgi:hypothetical protein